ncbi:hypothetical protein [Paenibacillus alkalitolerans]|uniref:hypothetical protein n=1 Tax=Paenibacillus alkalitolerans TaxID=2799335 RepID=UPI0018F4950C|nr:hypothetical protein [Paenibacillus alkalitolerans]
MVTITIEKRIETLEEEIRSIAAEWELTVIEEDAPTACFRLVPPLMLGIHGIWCELRNGRWSFWRESDATTWEDFLLMNVTHRLAYWHESLLGYSSGSGTRLLEPTPDVFLTFDHYADHVVRNEEGIVKDIKKNWIYTHRNRYVR